MATTVLGALVARLTADGAFAALAPSGVWTESIPPARPLPFVALQQAQPRRKGPRASEGVYLEKHVLRLLAFAQGAADPGADNPAEAVVDRAEALLDEKHGELDALLDGMDVVAVTVSGQRLREEKARVDDRRVYRAQADVTVVVQRQVQG
jgi:hypothetical protein